MKTLKKKKIPFREFKIGDVSEQVLGELFSYFILETVIVGKLANINPFDQPAVEEVKVYTKKILFRNFPKIIFERPYCLVIIGDKIFSKFSKDLRSR